jgi:cyanophycinase-like exopeptidase
VTLGVLALLGSGEIAPSMTKVHRQLLGRLSEVRAVSLDTPYGFQANVPQMTEKIAEYFATSLNVPIKTLHYLCFEDSTAVEREIFRQEVRAANYVFAGPGSPSYAAAQWEPISLDDDLRATLRDGGIVCFASAAALTLGALTVPVYEIYKVGSKAHWLPGLDVLSMTGIRGAIIPHFDNAEGGNYDTRYCYLGEDRLVELERQLPEDVGVLGIDEHTAAIIDLEARTLSVMGKGNVYWRRDGATRVLGNGSSTALDMIQSIQPVDLVEPSTTSMERTEIDSLAQLACQGGEAAVDAIARLARMATTGGADHIDPSPLVESLLELRVDARTNRDYALADRLRDILVDSGIEVKDGAEGSTWSVK